jgi:uncharacterized protein (DUF111 family)
MKKNEGKTREQIVTARLAENAEAQVHNKLHVLKTVDRLIEFLQTNREAIGGISVNVLADTGTTLYDPEDNDATEGMSVQVSTRQSIADSMDKHLQEIIDGNRPDEDEDNENEMPGFLREMLAHAGAHVHVIDGGAIHLTEGEKKGGH